MPEATVLYSPRCGYYTADPNMVAYEADRSVCPRCGAKAEEVPLAQWNKVAEVYEYQGNAGYRRFLALHKETCFVTTTEHDSPMEAYEAFREGRER